MIWTKTDSRVSPARLDQSPTGRLKLENYFPPQHHFLLLLALKNDQSSLDRFPPSSLPGIRSVSLPKGLSLN